MLDCTQLDLEPSSNATWGRICHNGTHGAVHLSFADTNERAMLLRIGGPHPQTQLFERGGNCSWMAGFRLCESGNYTAFVLLVTMPRPDLRRPCPIFHTPGGTLLRNRFYEWQLSEARAAPEPASCAAGLWRWEPDGNHLDHVEGR